MEAVGEIVFRPATRADLEAIVILLAKDDLGKTRETTESALDTAYVQAFEAIERDSGNEIIVGEDAQGIVGTMQLTYIPNLTFTGATRCQIEGVRVSDRLRGQGVGRKMIMWGVNRAEKNGCGIVQLTSNKTRDRAIAFYEDLGFEASHVGFKLYLD